MSSRRRGSRSNGTEQEDVQDPPQNPILYLSACTQPIPFSQWLLMMLMEFDNAFTAHSEQKRTRTTSDSLTGFELKAALKALVTLILL